MKLGFKKKPSTIPAHQKPVSPNAGVRKRSDSTSTMASTETQASTSSSANLVETPPKDVFTPHATKSANTVNTGTSTSAEAQAQVGTARSTPPVEPSTTDVFIPRINEKAEKRLEKALQKHEDQFIQQHNKTAQAIKKRDQQQANLTEHVLAKSDDPALVQTSLEGLGSVVGSRWGRELLGDEYQALSTGIAEGSQKKNAELKGVSAKKYAKPSAGAYFQAAGEATRIGAQAFPLGKSQIAVTRQAKRLDKITQELKNSKMSQLVQRQAQLTKGHFGQVNKKGALQSGSVQFSSAEEFAAALEGTKPRSNISKEAIQLHSPVEFKESGKTRSGEAIYTTTIPSLLPPEAPQPLPKPPKSKAIVEPERELSPSEEEALALKKQAQTLKELKARTQRKTELEKALPAEELQKTVYDRDYHQVNLALKGTIGTLNTGVENLAMIAIDQIIPRAATAPGFFPESRKVAYNQLGHSLGYELGDGTPQRMLQSQVKVEKLHRSGKHQAQELKDIHRQEAMEKELNMTVHGGEKFYDVISSEPGPIPGTFPGDSPPAYKMSDEERARTHALNVEKAERRWEEIATNQLSPAQRLYLDETVAKPVPSLGGIAQRIWNVLPSPWVKPT